MNNKTVLSIGKIHTFSALSSADKHNTRQEVTAQNIDIQKIYDNKILVSTNGLSFVEMWKEKFRQKEIQMGHKITYRSNAVLAFEIITGFSHEMSNEIDLDRWGEANVEWIKNNFGEDNIISSIMHLDESSPHIHTIVIPMKDGKLNAKSYTAGSICMYNLQTSYAQSMSQFGLERGRKRSKAKRKMLDKFYSSIDEIENIKNPEIKASESIDDYLERVKENCQEYALAAFNYKNQLNNEKLNRDEIIVEKMSKYKEAINLYEELSERYDGDLEKVRNRINQYRKIEIAVPKEPLRKLLDGVLQKFNFLNSLEFKKMPDKKKKKLLKDFGFEEENKDIKEESLGFMSDMTKLYEINKINGDDEDLQ